MAKFVNPIPISYIEKTRIDQCINPNLASGTYTIVATFDGGSSASYTGWTLAQLFVEKPVGTRISACTITSGGSTVRNFTSVLDPRTYEPCLYDSVSATYFYNKGSDHFNYVREFDNTVTVDSQEVYLANKELRSVFGSAENVSPEVMIGGVKGSTVVWNQTFPSIDGVSIISKASGNSVSSYSNGEITTTLSSISSGSSNRLYFNDIRPTSGHKYIWGFSAKSSGDYLISLGYNSQIPFITLTNNYQTLCQCISASGSVVLWWDNVTSSSSGASCVIKDRFLIDLTKMFGTDAVIYSVLGVTDFSTDANCATAATNFQKLFPASYYPYNAGMLLSTYGSVKLNQKLINGNFSNGTNNWSVASGTISSSDGTAILTINESGTAVKGQMYQNVSGVNGHKYYQAFTVKATATGSFANRINTSYVYFTVGTNYVRSERFYTHSGNNAIECNACNDTLATGTIVTIKDFICIDLTEMFGVGNEPTTVDEFRNLFPDDYYEYNPTGTWVPVGNAGVSSTGFNIWDEEWEMGSFSSDANDHFYYQDSTTQIRCKNFIPILPNTNYFYNNLFNNHIQVAYFDGDYNYIKFEYTTNRPFSAVSPSNAYYMKWRTNATVTTYNPGDICINLYDESRNGTYEPYWKGYYSLDFIQSIKTSDGEKLFPYGLSSALDSKDEIIISEPNAYGISWTEPTDGSSSTAPTRVGNTLLHKILPVQSLMKGCVLKQDGTINYYLDPYDWSKKVDGTASNLTGTDGNVMVEIPNFYYKCTSTTSGSTVTNTMLISLYQVDSTWKNSPRMYIGAYKARVINNVMRSVADGGIPTVASINVFTGRQYARANNPSDTEKHWNINTYDSKKTLWMLFCIEYCTFDAQAAFQNTRDANGYKRGGVGAGVTNAVDSSTVGYYAQTYCGYSNNYGNYSIGSVALDSASGGSTSNFKCRYRGIENPFGEVWERLDGAFQNNGTAYVTNDPLKFDQVTSNSSYDLTGYRSFGISTSSGWISSVRFGEYGDFLPKVTGTNSFGDYYWYSSGFRGVLFGGNAENGTYCGFACVNASNAPAAANSGIGSRLVYIL